MSQLDLTDRRILYELDLDSRQSFQELGRKVRISKEVANFRVKRLQKEGYIRGFITTMNVAHHGYFIHKLFYKFHQTTPAIEKEIIAYLQQSKRLAYLASLEGRYDLVFLLLAKDTQDLYSFLVPFREKYGDYILEQEILLMPAVHRFNFRFFYPQGKLVHHAYPFELRTPEIELLDHQIVHALAQNARINLVDLAHQHKTSINVIKYHLKRLHQQQLLDAHVLDVNFDRFGMQHFQINLSLKNHSKVNSIIAYGAQHPKSTFATVTLGKYDLALEFVVENVKELRIIINDLKEKYSGSLIDHDVFILEEHKIVWFPM